ncbi:MAG: flavodoxin family protein [Atopobiaceae bacterium]|nr:flavodoxin family protein [Atopobiaceae bacterium]
MTKIVAINGSPRATWNTATLVRDAAAGAEEAGAEVQVFDLYKLDSYQGCRSCFVCKTERSAGVCAIRDGLKPVLDAIREADGVVLGTPTYLGDVSAAVYALLERLVFQNITYKRDPHVYHDVRGRCLFIVTSNSGAESYEGQGFNAGMLRTRAAQLEHAIGPTQTFVCGSTQQVADYDRYDWTMFDGPARVKRHNEVFPTEREAVRALGSKLANSTDWTKTSA